jgi:hypothetical protein
VTDPSREEIRMFLIDYYGKLDIREIDSLHAQEGTSGVS